jgi:hypothetical protein
MLDGLSISVMDANHNPKMTRIVARIVRRFNLSARTLWQGVPRSDYDNVVKQNLKVREKQS